MDEEKKQKSMLGNSQHASRKDPTVTADTNTESHQLETYLGTTKLMRIRRVVGHPLGLASCPPVSSPSSSLPSQSPIAWVAKLDGMFGVGNSIKVFTALLWSLIGSLKALLLSQAYRGGQGSEQKALMQILRVNCVWIVNSCGNSNEDIARVCSGSVSEQNSSSMRWISVSWIHMLWRVGSISAFKG
eukprot:1145678-Pelagomonas_calceolata.AAC.2